MKRKEEQAGRIADNYQQSINNKNFKISKEGSIDFYSHKIVKYKLSGAQITKKQYFKILNVLRDLGILCYSTRGIRFNPIKLGKK